MSATLENFYRAIEQSFGTYPGIVGEYVKEWLKTQNEADFGGLMGIIVARHPLKFKVPPSIEELNGYAAEYQEAKQHQIMKEKSAKIHAERTLLLEGNEEKILIDGELMYPAEALMHLVTMAIHAGRNPKLDPEVIAFGKRYGI